MPSTSRTNFYEATIIEASKSGNKTTIARFANADDALLFQTLYTKQNPNVICGVVIVKRKTL